MRILLAVLLSLSSGLYAAWATGTTAVYDFENNLTDSTGQAADATTSGAISYVTDGAINGTYAIAPTVAGSGAYVQFPSALINAAQGAVEFYIKGSQTVGGAQNLFYVNRTDGLGIAWEIFFEALAMRADLNNAKICGPVAPIPVLGQQYYLAVTWGPSGTYYYIATATGLGNIGTKTLFCSSGTPPTFTGTNMVRLFRPFNATDYWNNTSGADFVRFSNVYKAAGDLPTVDPAPVVTPAPMYKFVGKRIQ